MAKRPPAIITIDEWNEPINFLLYGDSGCGKTAFALTAPKALVLACEPGTISAKRLGRTADIWPARTFDEVVACYTWLRTHPDHGYEWLIVDTLGDLQDHAMRSILDLAKKQNTTRDEDIPALQDYQKWYLLFKRYVKYFNELPVNCLYLAHTMLRTDNEGNDKVMPNILGQDYAIASKVIGSMQVVGYMEAHKRGDDDNAEIERRILTARLEPFIAKDRYVALPRWYRVTLGDKESGNMTDVQKRINAALRQGVRPSGPAPTKAAAPAAVKKATPPRVAAK